MSWWWNTGCMVIYNQTGDPYTVVYQSNPGYRLTLPPYGNRSWNGLIFPWCYDSNDILNKAFRFYRGAELPNNGVFFMYQPSSFSSAIRWTAFTFTSAGFPFGSYENGQDAGAYTSSLVDVFIQANGTPLAVQVRA